jgi:bacterioferritin
MKGSPRVVDLLNEVLTAELTAINQYFLHGEMCRNWGYERLYETVRKHSMDEMKHAENLIERILYLEGIPNVQRLGKINIGETVSEQLASDLKLETEAVARVNRSLQICGEEGDHGSRQLLEQILKSEEEHINWLEAQHQLVRQVGEQGYLAQQIHESE